MTSIRLLLLVGVAGGLAVYFAVGKKSRVQTVQDDPDQLYAEGKEGESLDEVRLNQKLISEFPLPGEEPAVPPDVRVSVEVDTSAGKNRLYFTINEAHGYYVETFELRVWYRDEDTTGPDDSPQALVVYLNRYLPARESLRTCVEVVPAELASIGGHIGTSRDWDVELVRYGRARVENPASFPPMSKVGACLD